LTLLQILAASKKQDQQKLPLLTVTIEILLPLASI